MPRTKISEFSATPGNNTDIDGINLAEGCAPSGINDAIRELMAQLKDFQAGTAGDSFNGPVGTTTPAAGAFTNLSASGTFALTGDQVQISEGGTGQTTANAAFNALAPSQSTHAGKYLKTDGTNTSWDAIDINTADITGTLPIANGGTGLTALGTGVQTALGQNVTGSGGIVLASSPSLTTPNLGTPSAVTLTNATGLPLSTGVTGTLATTNGGTGLTSFTANGVVYASSTSALTTGSALTFDGANLGVGTTSPVRKLSISNSGAEGLEIGPGSANGDTAGAVTSIYYNRSGAAYVNAIQSANSFIYQLSGVEGMRLTSTGLGIGTSSPSGIFNIKTSNGQFLVQNGTSANQMRISAFNNAGNANAALIFEGYSSEYGRFDSSGNLGLGVTPTSGWRSGDRNMQIGPVMSLTSDTNVTSDVGYNYYYNTSNFPVYLTNAQASRYSQYQGAHRWFTAGSGTAGTTFSFTQAMTLDASGNLVIGDTSASYRLDVKGSTGNGIAYRDGTVTNYLGTTGSNLGYLGTLTNHPVAFLTNNTERARITSGGVFLVGTTNDSVTAGAGTKISVGVNPRLAIVTESSTSATAISLYSTGAAAYRFFVDPDGTVYATNTTISGISDQRYKENIRDLDVGLDAVMALKPRKFDWKEGKGKDIKGDRGFIAQEFEQVFPDLIDEWKDPAPEGEEPYKSVRQDLIPVLVKAIQELKAQNDDLRARVAQLEAK